MVTQNLEKKYICVNCCFYSNKKRDYDLHCLTIKHQIRRDDDATGLKNTSNDKISPPHICSCGKIYKFRQGLWRHKKICNSESVHEQPDIKSLIITIMNENKELREQLKELIPLTGNMNTIHNTTNTINATQNNHFNIQVFLNEQCKDAINMSDFINTIQVSLEQMDYTKRHGLADGISKTIIENLNRLSIYERPLHCTDVKRETLYIKDNDEWTKEDSHSQVTRAIRSATFANYRTLKEWQGVHPDYNKDDTLTDYFLKTVIELGKSLEGIDKRVIKLLCREAYIRDSINQTIS